MSFYPHTFIYGVHRNIGPLYNQFAIPPRNLNFTPLVSNDLRKRAIAFRPERDGLSQQKHYRSV
jgi:hypothetical protein